MTDHPDSNLGRPYVGESQNAAERAPVEKAWRDLSRDFRIIWTLLAAAIPAELLLYWLLDGVAARSAILAVAGFVWMGTIGWFGLRVNGFACPRCRRPFYESWYFLKMLRSHCAHCDLPRDATGEGDAPGASPALPVAERGRTSRYAAVPPKDAAPVSPVKERKAIH